MTSRRLDFAERWLRDGLEVCRPPAIHETLDVDMTKAKATVEEARRRGIRITYTHIFVRALAVVLNANRDLHVFACGGRLYYPAGVDIAISVQGESFVAPTLVIERTEQKSLTAIAEEMQLRTPLVQEADRRMQRKLRKWGWVVPFGFMRRAILRILFRSPAFRRRGSGSFQLSTLSQMDQAMAPMFSASGLLVVGRVREKAVVREGSISVRPVSTLTCCADHRVWDGRAGERFLNEIRDVLESGVLGQEAHQDWAAARALQPEQPLS